MVNSTDNILHANFNQCTTATGRLSSSNPNLQNMPKGKLFPVRKAFVSRFEDGQLLEVDYSQLEFRIAGILAKDEKIKQEFEQEKLENIPKYEENLLKFDRLLCDKDLKKDIRKNIKINKEKTEQKIDNLKNVVKR